MTTKLRATEKDAQQRALGLPQPFPLTGDGPAMRDIFCRENHMILRPRCGLAEAVVDARYRDWLSGRRRSI